LNLTRGAALWDVVHELKDRVVKVLEMDKTFGRIDGGITGDK